MEKISVFIQILRWGINDANQYFISPRWNRHLHLLLISPLLHFQLLDNTPTNTINARLETHTVNVEAVCRNDSLLTPMSLIITVECRQVQVVLAQA